MCDEMVNLQLKMRFHSKEKYNQHKRGTMR